MNISSNYFIYIDILIGLIYLLCAIASYRKGFVFSIVKLLVSVFAIYIAWRLGEYLANLYPILNLDLGLVSVVIDVNALANHVIWFLICFLVFFIIISLVLPLLKFLSDVPIIGVFNKIGGLIIGLINATIVVSVLAMILSLPVINNAEEVKNGTLIRYVSSFTDDLCEYVIENTDIVEKVTNFDVNELMNKIDETTFESADQVKDFIEKLSSNPEDAEEVNQIMQDLNITDIENLNAEEIQEKLQELDLNSLTEEQKTKLMELYLKYTNE